MFLLLALIVWLLTVKPAQAQYTVWDTPVVYYDFNDMNAGNIAIKDKIGNNNATIYDSGTSLPTIDIGKYGQGLKFNGVSNYASAADSSQFSQTGSFSVEAWVKVTSVGTSGTFQTVVSKWDETTDQRSYRLTINNGSDSRAFPQFQVSTDGTAGNIKTVTGQTQIIANQWYLLQGYYNASTGTIYIYVNGVREGATTSVGNSLADTTSNFYLGTTKTGASSYANFLSGTIDEVRLTSGARVDGSLAYSQERGKPSVKLDFDDGSGLQTVGTFAPFVKAALVNFSGNSQWVAGVKNYALQFTSASSQYVDLGNAAKFQLGGSLTLSAWINVASLGNYAIISQPNTGGYTFQLTSGGELNFGSLGGTTVTSSGAGIPTSTWTFVAVSYDGSNAYFYVNGRLVSQPALALWTVTPGAVLVGKAGTTPNYFNGKMDQVMIYPYNRTLFEIYSDFAGGAITFGKNYSLQPRNAQKSCPTGFVWVPGDPLYGTKDFCAMKYDAKCANTSDLTTGIQPAHADACSGESGGDYYGTYKNSGSGCACNSGNNKQIVSVKSGFPIAYVAQDNGTADDAKSYCSGLGWHLMTNNEWMTIVRNAEKMGSNWCDSNGTNCGFSPGQSGKKLVSGHNDNTNEASAGGDANSAIIAGDDSQPCYGTTTDGSNNCGGAGSQRRTLNLSNGEVIWDMGGNVWQWTDNTITGQQPTSTFAANTWNWSGFTSDGAAGYLTGLGPSLLYDMVQPSNATWNANQGVGRIYHYNGNPGGPFACLRGGNWDSGSYAGAFTLHLNGSPSYSGGNSVGFRCVAPLE
ncbi:LamG domain-containing protein [Patescibacteria group bacterium]|nr:LamG domain-containing protein [Patescibacteria group bacterium]